MSINVPGPCTISFGTSGAFGTTKQGIVIRSNSVWKPVASDKTGGAPAGFIFVGKSAMVELTLVDKYAAPSGAAGYGFRALCSKIADGLLGKSSADDGVTSMPKVAIGALASDIAEALTITHRDGTTQWVANKAFLLEPGEITLTATRELIIPLQFIILPVAGVLFSTIPTYGT